VKNFASSSQNHDRSCSGSNCPTLSQNGKFARAYYYDGSDDYWFLDESFFNNAFSQRSYVFWIKPSTTSGTHFIYEEGGSWNGLAVIINNGELQYATRTSTTQYTTSYPFTDTSSWHQVGLTYDNGNMSLYLDGVLVNSTDTSSDYTSIAGHSNEGALGATWDSNAFGTLSGNFQGLIDEVQITTDVKPESFFASKFFTSKKTYYWKAELNDSFNSSQTATWQFTIADPEDLRVNITDPNPGSQFNISDTVLINATVESDQEPIINISYVKARIVFPDGTSEEHLLSNQGNDIYTYEFNNTDQIGMYNITIIAENTASYQNDSETSWFNVSYSTSAALLCEHSPCIANSSLIESRDNLGTPEPNSPNTIDSCTDGSSGTYMQDESIENITITDLNGTTFRGGDTVNITVTATTSSTVINLIGEDTPLPAGTALSFIDGKVVLETGDIVKVKSSAATSLDAHLSVMEIT
jgi:hypothetical protein